MDLHHHPLKQLCYGQKSDVCFGCSVTAPQLLWKGRGGADAGGERFKREIKLVREDMKCDFVVLIREPIKSIEEVKSWSSKRTQLTGDKLYKIMKTMEQRYGVLWRFCSREDAGKKIIDIIEWYDKHK